MFEDSEKMVMYFAHKKRHRHCACVQYVCGFQVSAAINVCACMSGLIIGAVSMEKQFHIVPLV